MRATATSCAAPLPLPAAHLADVPPVLLVAGADTHAATPDGTTALHIAARANAFPQVATLVAFGAPVHLRNASQLAPFDLATNLLVRCVLEPADY